VPLEKVDKAQVKRLLADLLQIRSPKTVEVTHAVISGIFGEAIELGYIDANPSHGLLKRVLPAKKKRVLNARSIQPSRPDGLLGVGLGQTP